MRKALLAAATAVLVLGVWSAASAHEQPPSTSTRTLGFFKTHEQALGACLAEGPVDLGFVTITTLEDGLGLLWGRPSHFKEGGKRGRLDQLRLLLARQTLVGTCNQRLFSAQPDPRHLLRKAVHALGDTDCDSIRELTEEVTHFNKSGGDGPFPRGFEPGPSTPQHARSLADDPTTNSGEACTSELDMH